MDWLLNARTPVAWIAATIAAIALFIAKGITKRRRNNGGQRRLAWAQAQAREKIDAVKRAIVSKDPGQLAIIAGLVGEVYQLAETNGFALHQINSSRERLDRWKYLAEEALINHDGKVPIKRLLAALVNNPINVINRDEPGTPGIEVNDEQLALPASPSDESGWQVRQAGQPIVTPLPAGMKAAMEAETHPIERMIEEAMLAHPEGDLLPAPPPAAEPAAPVAAPAPPPPMVEVITVSDDGKTTTTFEIEGDEPYIVITLDADDEDEASDPEIAGPSPPPIELSSTSVETAMSFDDQVDQWFDQIVMPD